MADKYLRIRVEGKEGYLKAFLNKEKADEMEPDYKGDGVAVWINEAKPAAEHPAQKPLIPPTRL